MTTSLRSKVLFSIFASAAVSITSTLAHAGDVAMPTSFVMNPDVSINSGVYERSFKDVDGNQMHFTNAYSTNQVDCVARQAEEVNGARNSAPFREMQSRFGSVKIDVNFKKLDVENPSKDTPREQVGRNLRINPSVNFGPWNQEKFENAVKWKLQRNGTVAYSDIQEELNGQIYLTAVIANVVKADSTFDLSEITNFSLTRKTIEPQYRVCHVITRAEITDAIKNKLQQLDKTLAAAVVKGRQSNLADAAAESQRQAAEGTYDRVVGASSASSPSASTRH